MIDILITENMATLIGITCMTLAFGIVLAGVDIITGKPPLKTLIFDMSIAILIVTGLLILEGLVMPTPLHIQLINIHG